MKRFVSLVLLVVMVSMVMAPLMTASATVDRYPLCDECGAPMHVEEWGTTYDNVEYGTPTYITGTYEGRPATFARTPGTREATTTWGYVCEGRPSHKGDVVRTETVEESFVEDIFLGWI